MNAVVECVDESMRGCLRVTWQVPASELAVVERLHKCGYLHRVCLWIEAGMRVTCMRATMRLVGGSDGILQGMRGRAHSHDEVLRRMRVSG